MFLDRQKPSGVEVLYSISLAIGQKIRNVTAEGNSVQDLINDTYLLVIWLSCDIRMEAIIWFMYGLGNIYKSYIM